MDTQTILTVAGIIFASSGFWTFCTEWYKTHGKAKTVLQKAVLALLHDKLYYLCRTHIEAREISIDELDNLTCLYTPYRAMGGNGVCEQLYNECKNLPKREGAKK